MKNMHTNIALLLPELPETKLKVMGPCQADVCLIKEKPPKGEIASIPCFKAEKIASQIASQRAPSKRQCYAIAKKG